MMIGRREMFLRPLTQLRRDGPLKKHLLQWQLLSKELVSNYREAPAHCCTSSCYASWYRISPGDCPCHYVGLRMFPFCREFHMWRTNIWSAVFAWLKVEAQKVLGRPSLWGMLRFLAFGNPEEEVSAIGSSQLKWVCFPFNSTNRHFCQAVGLV